MKYRQIKFI